VTHFAWRDGAAARAGAATDLAQAAACTPKSVVADVANPTAIAENRAHLTVLASTNYLGQRTPAIADADAVYERMYAGDMEAVCTYARGPGIGGVTGSASTSDVISAAQQVMTTLPDLVGALSSPYRAQRTDLAAVANPLSTLSKMSPPTAVAIRDLDSLSRATMLLAALRWGDSVHRTQPAAASLGSCASIATLSVPMRWVSHTSPAPDSVGSEAAWIPEPIRLVRATGGPMANRGDSTGD
jgi:PPE-repeat protein